MAYLHEVNLSVAGFAFSAFVGFAENEGFRRNVLGRRGFLEHIMLGLVDYDGQLSLNNYGNASRSVRWSCVAHRIERGSSSLLCFLVHQPFQGVIGLVKLGPKGGQLEFGS